MLFWILALALSAAVAAFALLPLWRRRDDAPSRSAHDVAVFKRQLQEIDRDVERGVIAEAEAEGARREISRRLLAASDRAEREGAIASAPETTSRFVLLASAAPIVLGGLALYLILGVPGASDRPLAARDFAAERSDARLAQAAAERLFEEARGPAAAATPPPAPEGYPDFASLLSRMERLVAERPTDVEGRILLSRAYMQVERAADAWPLLVEAQELMGEAAPVELNADIGQTMVLAAGGYVSKEARDAFEAAGDLPMSRYYIGLSTIQDGEVEAGLLQWLSLLREHPQAPYSANLRDQILTTAANAGLEIQPGALPPAPASERGPDAEAIAAAEEMSAEERAEMIDGMIAGLAARLEDNPNDLEGWARLIRSYGVLGRIDDAAAAFAEARAAMTGNALAMSALAETALLAGVPQEVIDAAIAE